MTRHFFMSESKRKEERETEKGIETETIQFVSGQRVRKTEGEREAKQGDSEIKGVMNKHNTSV